MFEGVPTILFSSMERAPWGWGLLAAVLLALIKGWPALAAQGLKAKLELGMQKRGDMNDLRARIESLEEKVETANAKAHNVELKLVSALAAYRLIASELQRLDPDSNILKQAQELLNVSYPTPRERTVVADPIRPHTDKRGANK